MNSAAPRRGGDSRALPFGQGELKKVALQLNRRTEALSLAAKAGEPDPLFEYVLVVGLQKDDYGNPAKPIVTYQFPPNVGSARVKDEALENVPLFCYPDGEEAANTKNVSSTYSLTVTAADGSRRHAYCRRLRTDGKNARSTHLKKNILISSLLPVECFVIISSHSCFPVFSSILDEVLRRRQFSSTSVFTFLRTILSNKYPSPGEPLCINCMSPDGAGREEFMLVRPNMSLTLFEHVDFSMPFTLLSPSIFLLLVESLLAERRICIYSTNIEAMSQTCLALLSAIHPFTWHHTYIPCLSPDLIDYLDAPTPYLMGFYSKTPPEVEDVVIVNLDLHGIHQPLPEPVFPPEAFNLACYELMTITKTNKSGTMLLAKNFFSEGMKSTRELPSLEVCEVFLSRPNGLFCSLFGPAVSSDRKCTTMELVEASVYKDTQKFFDMIIDTMNFQVFIDEITRGKPPELFVRLCDKLKNVQWDKAAENAVKESGQFTNVTMVVRRLLKPKKAKELIKWLE